MHADIIERTRNAGIVAPEDAPAFIAALRAKRSHTAATRAAALLSAADAVENLPQDFELDPGRGDAVLVLRRRAATDITDEEVEASVTAADQAPAARHDELPQAVAALGALPLPTGPDPIGLLIEAATGIIRDFDDGTWGSTKDQVNELRYALADYGDQAPQHRAADPLQLRT